MMKRILILAALASVLALSACSAPKPEPVSITLDMSEYAFDPASIEVKVGQEVSLELVNNGQLPHEVMFGREVVRKDNRPAGYREDMFAIGGATPEVTALQGELADEQEEEHSGFVVALQKTGDRALIKFTVTQAMVGEWEIGCFEQDGVHYDAGMVGKFIVAP